MFWQCRGEEQLKSEIIREIKLTKWTADLAKLTPLLPLNEASHMTSSQTYSLPEQKLPLPVNLHR